MLVNQIDQAVAVLHSGGLVAFPTETVYGLGADATNADAVQEIFRAKARPPTNPLICHVADATVARRYARDWPAHAQALAQKFWPGPLTLVLRKTDAIVPQATAGLDTVGLRSPDHPLALELLRAFGKPVAAPSANRSTQVSPTTAQHVREDLGDAVDLILDGGPCRVGIESTVLDLTGERPTILRPGGIAREQIEELIGPVDLFRGQITPEVSAPSPGQHPVHYAPRTPAFRFEPAQRDRIPTQNDVGVIQLGTSETLQQSGPIVTMPDRADEYARQFYAALRELDRMNLLAIYIEMPPDESHWLAIRDRIIRATRPL